MTERAQNNYPKLHNALWPGLVGKGSPGAEPCIDLDTMLDLTAKAEVNGVKFDGVDIFLFDPHISIDIGDDGLKKVAEKIRAKGLEIGSVVAPVWPPMSTTRQNRTAGCSSPLETALTRPVPPTPPR